ncbi:MAG: NADH-quinone oxidoreductase subunit NuoE [Pseudolabrys sp.]
MSVRRLAPAEVQPKEFAFSADNLAWANKQVEKYPAGRQASAIIPLLWRAQKQAGGWLPEVAIRYIADFLAMPHIRALEVATFYTMFNLEPVGRYYVQLCGTTPCMLRGAEDLKRVCRDRIGEPGHVTKDGTFSWLEVECLGACVNAPMVQINDDFYEDLNTENFNKLLDDLAAGRPVMVGPQIDRQYSAPAGGPTTLTDPSLYQTNGKSGAKSAGGTQTAVADADAKKPTKAASDREAPAPKPPNADKTKPKAR